mgnify:CR=1 FL=1
MQVFIVLLLPVQDVLANSVRIFTLSADEWARPRSGAVIPRMESIKLAMIYWESGANAAMLLNYPGEDSGELWASELKDWLISLGIPSDAILLSPGIQAKDEIRILVGSRLELLEQ